MNHETKVHPIGDDGNDIQGIGKSANVRSMGEWMFLVGDRLLGFFFREMGGFIAIFGYQGD